MSILTEDLEQLLKHKQTILEAIKTHKDSSRNLTFAIAAIAKEYNLNYNLLKNWAIHQIQSVVKVAEKPAEVAVEKPVLRRVAKTTTKESPALQIIRIKRNLPKQLELLGKHKEASLWLEVFTKSRSSVLRKAMLAQSTDYKLFNFALKQSDDLRIEVIKAINSYVLRGEKLWAS